MGFDIPRGVILPVERVDVTLDAAPHPFETANAADIEANWLSEKAANPALFDGQVTLLARLAYRAGRLEGACHGIRFATFLHWRRTRPWPDVEHAFAHAVPVTGDGALIAIRMGPRTASPGRVYFAAGSFDPQDFPGGKVDVDFNMAREVAEETGLDISGLPRDARYHALSGEAGTVIFRRYRLAPPAEAVAASIRAFVAGEAEPEIEEPVIIRSADDLPEGTMPYMAALVAWHFAVGEDGLQRRAAPHPPAGTFSP